MRFFITSIYLSTLIFLSINVFADVELFGSRDCPNCGDVKTFLDSSNVNYRFYDIDIDSNYDKLLSIEKFLKIKKSGDFPAVLINNKLFYFDDENFKDSVNIYLKLRSKKFFKIKNSIKQNRIIDNTKRYVVLFYKEGCTSCSRVDRHLSYLQSLDSNLEITKLSISKNENKRMYEALAIFNKISAKKRLVTPTLFFSDGYLVDEDCISNKIDSLIKKSTKNILLSVNDSLLGLADRSIKNRFKKFSLYTVIVAGFLDGINPCAFATLIFLVTYLIILKKTKKVILISGIAFTSGVFLAYFVVGIGFLHIVFYLNKFLWIKAILNILIFLSMLYFAVLNLYDFVMIKKNRLDKVKLELGFSTSKKIQDNIRGLSNSRFLFFKTFIIGVVISFLELACTGQVYLPTIVYMKETAPVNAVLYLLLYNIIFVIPIIAVFGLVFLGVEAKYFQRFLRHSSASVKLMFFIILSLMAIVIFLTQIISLF